MGAKFGYKSQLEKKNYESLQKEGVVVNAASSLRIGRDYPAGAAGGIQVWPDYYQAFTFERKVQAYIPYTVGARIPDDRKPEGWAWFAQHEPMPIAYTLSSIDTLLAKKIGNAADPKVIKMTAALRSYCTDYLLPK